MNGLGKKGMGKCLFRTEIRMEVELYADNQAAAHDRCKYILAGMEEMANHQGEDNPFTRVGLATAHPTVQG